MGGNYQKSIYDQLMDVMGRLEKMESAHKDSYRKVAELSSEVTYLRKENRRLEEKVRVLETENAALRAENAMIREENRILRDDNERMKRILSNDSHNSSKPPSSDGPGKPPNTYNGRKHSEKKRGAQHGHKGSGLSRASVQEKIKNGLLTHKIVEIGDIQQAYVTRYIVDIDVSAVATEVRIHADDGGKYRIPAGLEADVTYGSNVKAVAAYLYGEGVVANDRIADFINSLSGDAIGISTGSIYAFCRDFSEHCANVRPFIENALLNSHEICTDATTVTNNGQTEYIRNFSTESHVLYCRCKKKDIETLKGLRIASSFTGIFTADHETAIYHFGTGHAECNVHLARYLRKNTEETGNTWSCIMGDFTDGMNIMRRGLIDAGVTQLPPDKLAAYEARYDEIIAMGRQQNKNTHGRLAKKNENTLLNRLEKYRDNHLLFLCDFGVHYSNNMSERDLRICKNREKMSGGFRTDSGMQMYCDIMSFLRTLKRQGKNIMRGIADLMNGEPVIA